MAKFNTTNQMVREFERVLAPRATVMVCPADLFVNGFFRIQQDEHVKAWRWKCYVEGNWHEWPKYSNRIVYGTRGPADV